MQQGASSTLKELVIHTWIYSVAFALFALEAACGSLVSSFATRAIASKFVLRVLTAVEYTVVVQQAIFIVYLLVREQFHKVKRVFQ